MRGEQATCVLTDSARCDRSTALRPEQHTVTVSQPRGWTSEMEVWAGLAPSEASLLRVSTAVPSLCPHVGAPLCPNLLFF